MVEANLSLPKVPDRRWVAHEADFPVAPLVSTVFAGDPAFEELETDLILMLVAHRELHVVRLPRYIRFLKRQMHTEHLYFHQELVQGE